MVQQKVDLYYARTDLVIKKPKYVDVTASPV